MNRREFVRALAMAIAAVPGISVLGIPAKDLAPKGEEWTFFVGGLTSDLRFPKVSFYARDWRGIWHHFESMVDENGRADIVFEGRKILSVQVEKPIKF